MSQKKKPKKGGVPGKNGRFAIKKSKKPPGLTVGVRGPPKKGETVNGFMFARSSSKTKRGRPTLAKPIGGIVKAIKGTRIVGV